MEQLQLFKIGGNIIENPSELTRFCRPLKLKGKNIVHGGGKRATAMLTHRF